MLDDLVNDYKQRQVRALETLKIRIANIQRELGDIPAANLTERQIDLYVKKRFSEGRKIATVQSEVKCLRQAFMLAQRKNMVEKVPHIPRFRLNNARQGFFEAEDFERVISFLPDYLEDFTRFAYYSGWRRNEIATLEWRDIQDGVIRLRPEVSKTSEGRLLILTGVIADIIDRRREERKDLLPYVFYFEGRRIGRFERSWRTACKKAGVPGKVFHDLRRTAVRNMVRAGIPERTAMSISGHKTRAIFDRYNIVNEEDIRQAMTQTFEYLEQKDKTIFLSAYRTKDAQ